MIGKTILLCFLATLITSTGSFAAPPDTISYQGYITDTSGAPVSSPSKAVGFAIYISATDSTPIWSESQNIRIDKGIYSALLGAVTPLSLPFDRPYFLGITIFPDPELTPRQALTSTPYARNISMPCQDGGILIYKSGTWQCGAVTTLPNAAAVCIGPDCIISMCSPGWGNCNIQIPDGCETDIRSNAANCGVCGNICSAPANMLSTCANSSCIHAGCLTGWGNCNNNLDDGCETNTTGDMNNCGSCSVVCAVANGTPACVNSACTVASCSTNWGNCDGVSANGCESNLLTSSVHCGGCGRTCTGTCVSGACKKSLGGICSADMDCLSGFCTDGVCCESRCGGSCEKCSQTGRLGFCDALPFNTDPDNECTTQSTSTCGTNGFCSGSRTCAFYTSGTVAVAASCTSNILTQASTCNGLGGINIGAVISCVPYTCSGSTACKTSCSINSDCVTGYNCASGNVCKKINGNNCGADNECASGFCTDGVCCDSRCGGTCEKCSQSGRTGFCDPIPSGMDPDNECANACNGARACQ